MLRRTFLTSVGLCGALLAQQQQQPAQTPEPEPAPIRVRVNEVIVPVTVTDDKGAFVSNLVKDDFQILENGRPQQIRYFSHTEKQPIVVGFLLDLSSFSRTHWKQYQESAEELVWNMLPDDRSTKMSGFLVTYSTEAELSVNTTDDSAKIVDKIRTLKPGGGSAMYDAIEMAITKHKQVKGEPLEPRRVLIVIGSGDDNSSKRSLEEVLELAQRNLVTIYGMSTTAYGFRNEGEDNMTRLAAETGGHVEYPLQNVYKDVSGYLSKPQDAGNYALDVASGAYASAIAQSMFHAVGSLAGDVTTQYILRYVPDGNEPEQQFRKITVQVNLPGAKVRARKGYYPYEVSAQ